MLPWPTHAGAVVVRTSEHEIDYLLVRARTGQPKWVLPKGRIELGETLAVSVALTAAAQSAGLDSSPSGSASAAHGEFACTGGGC